MCRLCDDVITLELTAKIETNTYFYFTDYFGRDGPDTTRLSWSSSPVEVEGFLPVYNTPVGNGPVGAVALRRTCSTPPSAAPSGVHTS